MRLTLDSGHLEGMNLEVIIETTSVDKLISGEFVAVVREESSSSAHAW